MNKTAMQKHLEWLKYHFKDIGKLDYECVVAQLEMHIEDDEKQNIVDAFKAAYTLDASKEHQQWEAEEYYNDTFKNK